MSAENANITIITSSFSKGMLSFSFNIGKLYVVTKPKYQFIN